jgi:hypothetical protein
MVNGYLIMIWYGCVGAQCSTSTKYSSLHLSPDHHACTGKPPAILEPEHQHGLTTRDDNDDLICAQASAPVARLLDLQRGRARRLLEQDHGQLP